VKGIESCFATIFINVLGILMLDLFVFKLENNSVTFEARTGDNTKLELVEFRIYFIGDSLIFLILPAKCGPTFTKD
jgi:heme/copper-type cytochrome/quinol oxidase subunit 2